MLEPANFYVNLSTREGFNASVRHINKTLDLLDACNPKNNIADEINRLLMEKVLITEEVQAAVNMLLVEKGGYQTVSRNITAVSANAEAVALETAKWKAVDLVIGYHHPDLGFIVINPKNPESAPVIASFRKNELVIMYALSQGTGAEAKKNASLALPCLLDLLEDRKSKAPASLLSGSYNFIAPKKPAKAKPPASASGISSRSAKVGTRPSAAQRSPSSPSSGAPAILSLPAAVVLPSIPSAVAIPGQSKITPLISVSVTNELFHNGNVEAWKRIIRSFNAKYPHLQVSIYYDGERIIDINTLFKWGKVKHGSVIQFRVAGDNIQDLAKLSRYFKQGASSQYEAFLHGSPDTVMNLF